MPNQLRDPTTTGVHDNRRLTNEDIACWVVKTRTPPAGISTGWQGGATRQLARCLRRTYRLGLMLPGQLCLLWLSGRDDPGVQAVGHLSSAATSRVDTDPSRPDAEVVISLHLLRGPILRDVLRADHVFSDAEVLRMPAGSNPSYLRAHQLDVVRTLISPADPEVSGW